MQLPNSKSISGISQNLKFIDLLRGLLIQWNASLILTIVISDRFLSDKNENLFQGTISPNPESRDREVSAGIIAANVEQIFIIRFTEKDCRNSHTQNKYNVPYARLTRLLRTANSLEFAVSDGQYCSITIDGSKYCLYEAK
jgi:hypothetical protein